MRIFKNILIAIWLLLPSFLDAQATELYKSGIRYSIADGLPSNNIYDVLESSRKEIWVATEKGVALYDAKKFQVFTTENGLSDNEVFQMFEDDFGRIWFLTYSGSPSFYQNGRFFNSFNMPSLGKVEPGNFLMSYHKAEDSSIFLGSKNGKIYHISGRENPKADQIVELEDGSVYSLTQLSDGRIWAMTTVCEYILINGNRIDERVGFALDKYNYPPRGFFSKQGELILGHGPILSAVQLDGEVDTILPPGILPECLIIGIKEEQEDHFWLLTTKGAFLCDRKGTLLEEGLNGHNVASTMEDHEGGRWFATNNGLYYFPGNEVQLILPSKSPTVTPTSTFCDDNGTIWIGFDDGQIFFSKEEGDAFQSVESISKNDGRNSSISQFLNGENGKVIAVSNSGIFELHGSKVSQTSNVQAKKVHFGREGNCLACHTYGVTQYSGIFSKGVIGDIMSQRYNSSGSRCLDLVCDQSDFCLAKTSVGFEIFDRGKLVEARSYTQLGTQYRNVVIGKGRDSTILLAGPGIGIYTLINGKPNRIMPPMIGFDGFFSSILQISSTAFLIGTNKGIVRLSIGSESKEVEESWVGREIGMPDDEIRSIFLNKGIVWFATKSGVWRFDSKLFRKGNESLDALFGEIRVNGQSKSPEDLAHLNYDENSIAISYRSSSFRSLGDAIFRYRLLGADTNWIITNRDYLEYPDLAPGQYVFQVQAKDRNSNWQGKVGELKINVNEPFWRKTWFLAMIPITILLLISLVLFSRLRGLRIRWNLERAKNDAEQRMLSLQMNPHFIFNALNSIQGFVLRGNAEASNEYLVDFSDYMRQMLVTSRNSSVSLQSEVEYLEKYIRLEGLRSTDGIAYKIDWDSNLDAFLPSIPSLMLQPLVENAIIHGIIPLKRKGLIQLAFKRKGDYVHCIVEDNGIGRSRSSTENRGQKGTSLALTITNERIAILNMNLKNHPISLEIEDLYASNGEASGTKATLKVPVSFSKNLR